MRRWIAILLLALSSLSLVLSGCPKKETLKDPPAEGEDGPDQGPDIPGPR